MSKWLAQFQNHAVQASMSDLAKLIQQSAPPVPDEAQIEAYNRLLTVVSASLAYLRTVPPEFTSRDILDTFHNAYTNIHSELTQYLRTKNAGHLANANSHADRILVAIPANERIPTQEGFGLLLNDVQRNVQSLIASLTTTAAQYTDSVKKLQTTNESLQKRIEQQEGNVNSQKERLDKIIAEYQKLFLESEQARRKQIEQTEKAHGDHFTAFKEEIGKQIKLFIDQKTPEVATTLATFKNDAKAIIQEMEQKKKDAANLLQITANILVTGDYETLAGQERISADRWRNIAIACMIGVAIAAVVIVEVSIVKDNINWQMIMFRYATAALLLFPALYAISESARHRKQEHRFRRLQLELASIDPFLESLPKEKRDELKKTLADRIFAQPEVRDDKDGVGAKQLIGIVEKAVDNLTHRR